MSVHFETATIIGVGLLGGSLGLALKERKLADRVRGVGRRQESLDKAVAVGAVDEVSLDARAACEGADLVVVCTPAAMVTSTLDMIQPACGPDCVVTDVASTKAEICDHARRTWPRPCRFVGSHPMAGSEKFGPENACSDLYEASVTFVEIGDVLDSHTRESVKALWEAVGSQTVDVRPSVHDSLVARTSHIPHIAAACMAILAAREGDVQAFAGKGFRDATRIAGGRPEIWRDICLTNGRAIVAGLEDLIHDLSEVCDLITDGDASGLDALFADGNAARQRVVSEP